MALEPITRAEQIMSGESLDPITREEMFLAKAAGMDVDTPEPITRREMFLSMIQPGGGVAIKNQDKTITENGTYKADSGYTGLGTVSVNVPSEEPVLQEKTVAENGTVLPDVGYDGLSKVVVDVPGIVPSGTIDITENGSYDVTNFATALVEIAGASAGAKVATGSFTLTTDSVYQSVTHDLGEVPSFVLYYSAEALKNVTGASSTQYTVLAFGYDGGLSHYVWEQGTTYGRQFNSTSKRFKDADNNAPRVARSATTTTMSLKPVALASGVEDGKGASNLYFKSGITYNWIAMGEGS